MTGTLVSNGKRVAYANADELRAAIERALDFHVVQPPLPRRKPYRVRSHDGRLNVNVGMRKDDAAQRAVELAIAHPGVRVHLYRNGRMVPGHTWLFPAES
jgi:hypothetical protein